ncbi:hypothetical protein [Janthinobacterium lividum]|uniref:hypothetical protein n=1 Tax=Janthinobacterium lividum TaxID=29581 RepID=UPI0015962650|nr:hypothetical protein [Janthinobacterium lividum]QKY08783.1 hypothetical protein G8765_14165 [Janthinobacterium lividum]
MTVDIATLQIRIDSTDTQNATRNLEQMNNSGGRAEQSTNSLTGAAKKLADVLKMVAGAAVAIKLYESIKEATLLASRYNELGIVMGVLARNSGIGSSQISQTEAALRKTGISAIQSRDAIAKLISANIDLSKATELARLAQDAAVIGGTNSSEAFERLIKGIQSAEKETLETMGLNVNFQKSYEDLAKSLKKSAKDLTTLEKTQAATNAVMEKAPAIAGTYEASLGNAGKQMRSMARYVEDLKVQLGQPFQNPFDELISNSTKALKYILDHAGLIRSVMESVVASILPAMKIASAYFAIFIAGPAILTAVAAAFTPLIHALALYTMNVMIGQTQTIYFNRTLFGTSVSALLAAGSLTKLALAIKTLFAAFVGWEIGTYLDKEFQSVRLSTHALIDMMLVGWENMKYGALMAFQAVEFGWSKTVSAMKAAWGGHLVAVASGLKLIGATDTAQTIKDYADGLLSVAASQKTFAEQTKGITTAHERELAIIDMTTKGLLAKELATTGAKLATAGADAATANKKVEQIKLTEEQIKAYEAAVKSAKEYIAQMQIEASEIGKSEDQVKMMAAARAAAKAPTAALRMEIMQGALALDIETKAFAASEATKKSMADATQLLADSRASEYTAMAGEVQANKDAIETYGMSKAAIEALTLARMEDRLARRGPQDLDLEEAEVNHLMRMIGLQKEKTATAGTLEDREKEKKAVEDRLAEQMKMWESIDTTAHDTFVSIFDSGKSAFDRLRDTLKNGLLDLLYQMTIKKWILNIGASVSGAGATSLAMAGDLGAASGAVGGGLGGVANLAQSAKTAYTIATQGFSGVAAGIGGSIATLGNLFGSSAVSAFGAGMGMTGAQAAAASAAYGSAGMAGTGTALTSGAVAGAAVTAAAGIAAGVLGGRMISGQYGSNSTVNAGTGIGAVAGAFMGGPIGAAIGGALGGLIGGLGNRVFGMGEKKYGETGITGTLSGTGFSGTEYAKWTQKGGWLRSDKKDTDRKAVDATTSNAFVETYAAIRNVSATLANTLGIDTSSLATRAQALNINLTGLTTEADRLGAVTKFFEGVGNAIAVELLPNVGQFKQGNEELSATLQRVAGNYAGVDAALQLIGRTSQDAFGAVGVATIGARENLIKLAGSLDSLTSGTSFFAENFLTEAEQMAPVLSTVADTLGKLGMSGVKSVEQYKDVVLGLDLASTGGQEMYIKLLALAPAFKAAADYSSQLAAATGNYAAVVKTASEIASERMDLQKQLNELTKSETELLAIQRSSIAAVNRALFDQVQAAKAVVAAKDVLAKAYDREAAAAQTALDKSKSWVATLNGLNASMALGSQSTLTPEQKYAEARAQFEKTLAAANAGDTTAQSGLSAAEQAFLTASQVVNASDARYAADYARVVAANNEALKWASAQVDVQQASLDALKAQVSGLITINDSVLTVAQAIANLHAAMGTAKGLGVQFDGSHAGGLANVPFDGYAAELHRGEVVVDAQAAAAMRRYFGGAPSQGGGNTDALVAEIKGLREEVKGLRADQAKQTGATIQATAESNDKAAKTVVAGVDKSAKASAWAKQVEYSQ